MLADLVLPGSIMLLKFSLKAVVENEVKQVDVLKALTMFPVDVAFLSLSYGSAILYANPSLVEGDRGIKTLLATVLVSIIFLLPVIVLSKKSEKAFVLSQSWKSTILAAIAYSIAIPITAYSTYIGGLFQ